MSDLKLNPLEKKVAFTLAGIFGMRMIGLFMILPIFALYGQHLEGFSPMWIGIAIGAYGLTQACLQIPMGILSDRIGRKPVILIGLVVFAIGSLVAAMADNVFTITIGRAMQGMGAIASTVLALSADLSREQQRPKVMAIIGAGIGLSFALSLLIGPILAEQFGLSGLFIATAVFAIVGVLLVLWLIPNPIVKAPTGDTTADLTRLKSMLKDPQLVRLDAGILILHLCLTAMFVVVPMMLIEADYSKAQHWKLYFPVFMLAFVLMVPMILIGVRKNITKPMFQFALVLLLAGTLLLTFASTSWLIAFSLLIFFIGFNYLEASLPSLIAKLCPIGAKGSAMGVYSTSQFLGAFLGGLFGGVLYQYLGQHAVLLFMSIMLLFWLFLSIGMVQPKLVRSVTISTQFVDAEAAVLGMQKLSQLEGVDEAIVVYEEQVAYLRVGNKFDVSLAKAVVGSVN
ncbi:MFS transporter [Paraferrimonas sp. SM1919]|uniref:MFS transporter n=1 Tax=Paraferrimonas sp. SM1919 TaxID=2662263 RepID=UPI0013D79C4C|nr:MFS transporter [Paraferrimonas sp. SM1919]